MWWDFNAIIKQCYQNNKNAASLNRFLDLDTRTWLPDDILVKADIRGILNLSPCHINVPKKVKVITIDIAMDLARLSYYIPSSRVT